MSSGAVGLTFDVPEEGELSLYGTRISGVEHWFEDGDHVLRSTEFDLIAGAPSLEEAAERFVESLEDLAEAVGDLVRAERSLEHERDVGLVVLGRLAAAYKAGAREVYRETRLLRVLSLFRRRRGDSRGRFLPSSAPPSSPPPAV